MNNFLKNNDLKKDIKFIKFDSLASFFIILKKLNISQIDIKKINNESEIINAFLIHYLKYYEIKNTKKASEIIINKILNILNFLTELKLVTIKTKDIYEFENETINYLSNYVNSLNFLISVQTQLIEKFEININDVNKDFEYFSEYLFINQLPIYKNKKTIWLTIIDLIDNDFINELKKLEFVNTQSTIIKILQDQKIINNITNEEKIQNLIKENQNAYIGFDPSADSLHLGNYVMINIINKLNQHHLKTYPMVGGATGMIGDPSGKKAERVLLNQDIVIQNKNKIIQQLKEFANSEIVLDNLDNFKNFLFLDFLRDVGKYINVNYLLEKEIIKDRLEVGISFTEFSYSLIQGYDFLKFYEKYNIALQIGGSDQWGNITTGIELIRKIIGDKNNAAGVTINLLTKSDGTKFGKSEKGAIFLNKNKTSIYEMYQFLINQTDDDVLKLINFLTELSIYEINVLNEIFKNQEWSKFRIIQNALAKLIVCKIHSLDEYLRTIEISKILFTQKFDQLTKSELEIVFKDYEKISLDNKFNTDIVNFLVDNKIINSKREARELITNNSIAINGNKINDIEFIINENLALYDKFIIIKKGKKHYFVCELN